MFNIKSSKIIRRFKCGYNVHEEIWEYNENKFETVKVAYTPNGEYIGSTKEAHKICNILGITPQKINKNYGSCNIGFSKKDQKWYAWAHGILIGFGIGSKITKDSYGYIPSTPQELYEKLCSKLDLEDIKITKTGVRITTYAENTKPTYHYIKCGRGEWKAKTLADAKLMAIATAKCII